MNHALPDGLLLGSATSATQIEGGDLSHSWSRWADQGRVKDGTRPKDAVGHWERVQEDVALLAQLNQQTYRFGVEWARVQPTEDAWDEAAVARYRDELEALRAAGIIPLVTLHHFTNPVWVEERGGWVDPSIIRRFLVYVERIVAALGDLVSDWITVNEPNVYAYHGHLQTIWPPGKRDFRACRMSVRNMLRAHIQTHRRIHELQGSEARVGLALHLCSFAPAREGKRLDRWFSKVAEHLFQESLMFAHATGSFMVPYGFPWRFNNYPEGSGDFTDFVGVNYYRPCRIKFAARTGLAQVTPHDAETNDLGWEIDAKGLYRVCRDCYEALGKPIYVTENGVADSTDARRSRFIYDHLAQVVRAIGDGVPIQRYYHWSFLDNFEWEEGLSAKFGLVAVDPTTHERAIKPSGARYARICATRALEPPSSP